MPKLMNSPSRIPFNGDEELRDDHAPAPHLHWIWLVLGFVAALAIFSLGALSQSRSTRPAIVGPIEDEGSTPGATPIVAHVAGQVSKPGVYEFPFDARVRDAIRKAGGPTKDADLNAINLAAYLEDGQKIEVPPRPSSPATTAPAADTTTPPLEYSAPAPEEDLISIPTEPEPKTTRPRPAPNTATTVQRNRPKTEKPLPDVPRASTPRGEESQNADPKYFEKNPLNLNKATAEQLELLPGIGPAMAEKILAARKEKGGFKSVDDLDEVPGIGEKTMEKLRPLVTVT